MGDSLLRLGRFDLLRIGQHAFGLTLPLAVGSFAAPLGVLGIFWANAALLLGATGVMVGSKPGDAEP